MDPEPGPTGWKHSWSEIERKQFGGRARHPGAGPDDLNIRRRNTASGDRTENAAASLWIDRMAG
jgi:hypothetical protein